MEALAKGTVLVAFLGQRPKAPQFEPCCASHTFHGKSDHVNDAGALDLDEVRQSPSLIFSVERMFDLIEAAEHYPEFLPWCARVRVLARDESVVSARIAVNYHGMRFHFVTRNPKRRPEFMSIQLEERPFRHFEGEGRLAGRHTNRTAALPIRSA